ncbi:ABC transporter [Clostridiales bacterium PH28_bin88]|nr:ABC transporter [Clostridiales bacterium PH28_bin88]
MDKGGGELQQPAVKAENLTKKYREFTAVNGINFRIPLQECFGFLGPNGAGKTTTVKMMYGFSPVTGGSLEVLGLDVMRFPREVKARLGVVPQEDNLDPELTVEENLLVYASYFGIPRREAKARAKELLGFVELEEKTGTPVEQLSGGMKRRLTIARALVHRPELLLLDEPTTGLDPQARRLVWQRLRQLKTQGVTMVLTTHYMEEAEQLCDRLVVMERGDVLDEGSPDELIRRHVGREVLELGGAVHRKEEVLAALQGHYREYTVVGEALFLFTSDGPSLWRRLEELPYDFYHRQLRAATLEDVFLKLTGRGLNENGKG